ncbi:MAG: glycosyltransferase [Terracidiphilus sp.]
MPRIAVVTSHFPSSHQPAHGRPVYETLRVLPGEFDARVFYPHAAYPNWLRPRGRSDEALDPSYRPPGVEAEYFDYRALPLVSRPLNGAMAARALLAAVRRFAPDLILSYFLYPDGYAALRIGREIGVPVVAMAVGSDVHSIGDRISRLLTQRVLRKADFLFAISEDLRQRMLTLGAAPEKIRTLTSGCDFSVFHPMDRLQARKRLGIDPDTEAVVYIGRMDLKKGLRELVAAARSLHPERPRLRVYLVGEGADRPLIESAIAAIGTAGLIHLLPRCSFSEVAIWMAASDLVTLPSYMEGCPNVVLEALACGRPVVATNVGGIPEILGEGCGRLVPPRDPDKLAGALASVLDQHWDAAAIAARGGRSWETVAAELLEVLRPLAAAASQSGADQRKGRA